MLCCNNVASFATQQLPQDACLATRSSDRHKLSLANRDIFAYILVEIGFLGICVFANLPMRDTYRPAKGQCGTLTVPQRVNGGHGTVGQCAWRGRYKTMTIKIVLNTSKYTLHAQIHGELSKARSLDQNACAIMSSWWFSFVLRRVLFASHFVLHINVINTYGRPSQHSYVKASCVLSYVKASCVLS